MGRHLIEKDKSENMKDKTLGRVKGSNKEKEPTFMPLREAIVIALKMSRKEGFKREVTRLECRCCLTQCLI